MQKRRAADEKSCTSRARTFPSTLGPTSAQHTRAMPRVGRLQTLGKAVYARADGTLWYRLDGRRKPVHGAQLWIDLSGRRMRGTSPLDFALPTAHDDSDDDGAMQAAILASLQDVGEDAGTSAEAGSAAPTCPICLSAIGQAGVRSLRCGHAFHGARIARWLRSRATCPVCRVPA